MYQKNFDLLYYMIPNIISLVHSNLLFQTCSLKLCMCLSSSVLLQVHPCSLKPSLWNEHPQFTMSSSVPDRFLVFGAVALHKCSDSSRQISHKSSKLILCPVVCKALDCELESEVIPRYPYKHLHTERRHSFHITLQPSLNKDKDSLNNSGKFPSPKKQANRRAFLPS